MQLLKFRIVGHPAIPASPWIEVGPGLNVLRTGQEGAQALLRMLQTVNPPYALQHVNPFGDFPLSITHQTYSRKIIPAKKTVALALFAASPQLVAALAALDPLFYETGWIELGRRRDYSQWLNFVELSGSTRYSEIAATLASLLSLVGPEATGEADDLRAALAAWRGSDRIKGQGALQLTAQLQALGALLPEEHRSRLDPCFRAIDRASHFSRAKEVVTARLPLFLALSETTVAACGGEATGTSPLAALAVRLGKQAADPEHTLRQVNLQLATLPPDRQLRYRVEGGGLCLESASVSAPRSLSAWPAGAAIEALLTALALLHEALYWCAPICLVDTHGLKLPHRDRVALLEALRRFCSSRQCLVAPDDELLALCTEFLKESAPATQPWLRLVDVDLTD